MTAMIESRTEDRGVSTIRQHDFVSMAEEIASLKRALGAARQRLSEQNSVIVQQQVEIANLKRQLGDLAHESLQVQHIWNFEEPDPS